MYVDYFMYRDFNIWYSRVDNFQRVNKTPLVLCFVNLRYIILTFVIKRGEVMVECYCIIFTVKICKQCYIDMSSFVIIIVKHNPVSGLLWYMYCRWGYWRNIFDWIKFRSLLEKKLGKGYCCNSYCPSDQGVTQQSLSKINGGRIKTTRVDQTKSESHISTC